jgi:haloacid dehalogenase-like hydrolase
VAVANAAPEVLEAADVVTAANTDDGVALLLERILQADGGESAFGRRSMGSDKGGESAFGRRSMGSDRRSRSG